MRNVLLALGLIFATTAKGEEYVLLGNLSDTPPRIGDGFDPTKPSQSRLRKTAISFEKDKRRENTLHSDVHITELVESNQVIKGSGLSSDFGVKDFVTAKTGQESYSKVLEKHSVFVVQALFINNSEEAVNIKLNKDASGLDKNAFRDRFGIRVVNRIEFGGFIYLVYVFDTREVETRKNILKSLQASYSGVNGGVSFNEQLQQSGVRTEYKVYNSQDGGNVVPFLGTNLSEFRAYLDTWVPSIEKRPVAVRYSTNKYKTFVDDFPHDWPDAGFGKTVTQ